MSFLPTIWSSPLFKRSLPHSGLSPNTQLRLNIMDGYVIEPQAASPYEKGIGVQIVTLGKEMQDEW